MKPVDIVMIVLAVSVLIVLAAPAIRSLVTGVPITDKGVTVIANVLGGIIAVIGIYIGKTLGDKDDD